MNSIFAITSNRSKKKETFDDRQTDGKVQSKQKKNQQAMNKLIV